MILNPFERRQLGQCFYLVIGGDRDCEDAIAAAVRDGMAVERAVDALLDGEVDTDDFLDLVEAHTDVPVEAYLNEVLENLEDYAPRYR